MIPRVEIDGMEGLAASVLVRVCTHARQPAGTDEPPEVSPESLPEPAPDLAPVPEA